MPALPEPVRAVPAAPHPKLVTSAMRVLILWADDASPNLGVRALGRGSAELVRRIDPDAEIVFLNYGHRPQEVPIGSVRSLLRERVTGRLGMMKWFAGFDLAVDTRSGDSFADIYGVDRLAVMSTVAEFVTQAGVPVVLGPQTVGPFDTRRGRAIARHSIRRAASVMVRDSISSRYLDSIRLPADVDTTDVVFALPVPTVAKTRDVVVNVSGLLWQENPHVDAAAYRDTVRSLYRRLIDEGRRVTLLEHVLDSKNSGDNDAVAARALREEIGASLEVVTPAGLDEVRDTVASARVVIGSRMHACLNALSTGTPAIPLAYSRKFAPLLGDLGWEHTLDLRTDAKLVDKTLALAAPESVEKLTYEAEGLASRARSRLGIAEDALRELVAA